jgi:hypothetical protein
MIIYLAACASQPASARGRSCRERAAHIVSFLDDGARHILEPVRNLPDFDAGLRHALAGVRQVERGAVDLVHDQVADGVGEDAPHDWDLLDEACDCTPSHCAAPDCKSTHTQNTLQPTLLRKRRRLMAAVPLPSAKHVPQKA